MDIWVEVDTLQAARAQANRQHRQVRELMADLHSDVVHDRTVSNRRLLNNEERVEISDRRADLIQRENHFNFIKMHYLTDLASQILLDAYGCIQTRSVNL